MDTLLNRYRNLTVLLVVICAQVVLLAYQVRSNQDVRLIRVWAVTAVTPLARILEGLRTNTVGFLEDYVTLRQVHETNRRLKEELDRLKVENQFLKTELGTADRARALTAFQSRTPSRTIAARIIGAGTAANSKVVFIDRGSTNGVMKGMAVVTPDGIAGKVLSAYVTASQVLLITDSSFAAGVISETGRVSGTLKGLGQGTCLIDYVQNEEKVELGERFYTSGDDRVFPRGLPVGVVNAVRTGKTFKEIYVVPSGLQQGLGEVLVVLEGVHQPIPEMQSAAPGIRLLPPPPSPAPTPLTPAPGSTITVLSTDADRLRERYKKIGEAQGHVYGVGAPGSKPPDFNLSLEKPPADAKPQAEPAPAEPSPPPAPKPVDPNARPSGSSPAQALPPGRASPNP